MALKKPITDIKGVKTRYHKVAGFEYKDGKLVVKVRHYVNQVTRDAEKNAIENNKAFYEYVQNTQEVQNQLDQKSAQLALMTDDTDERKALETEVIALTEAYNRRVVGEDRPELQDATDRYYSEDEQEVAFTDPLSLESLYGLLTQTDKYKDAESV